MDKKFVTIDQTQLEELQEKVKKIDALLDQLKHLLNEVSEMDINLTLSP